MKKIILLFILPLCAVISHAQNPMVMKKPMNEIHYFPDSIRLEYPDQHGLVIFKFKAYLKAPNELTQNLLLTGQIIETLERNIASTDHPQQVNVVVSSSGERKIVMTETTIKSTQITTNEKETLQLLPPGWEIRIHLPDAELYVYAQTFAELKILTSFSPESLKQLMLTSADKVGVGRKRIVVRAIIQKNEMVYNDIKFQMPSDILKVTGSTAVGFFSNHLYPELNLTIAVVRGNHFNRKMNSYSLIYNNLFFTSRSAEGRYSNHTNSFLSFAWTRKFGSETDNGKVTLGGGYLIYKTGDYFNRKTAKFFFSTTVGPFAITPELYLTNDFKSFQTGIKFEYTF